MMPNTVEGERYLTRNSYTGNFHGNRDYNPYPTIYIPELELQICKHGPYRSEVNQISLVEVSRGNLSYKAHQLAIQAEKKSRVKVQIPRKIAFDICSLVDLKEKLEAKKCDRVNDEEIASINFRVAELAKPFLYPPTEKELKVFGYMPIEPKQAESKEVVTSQVAPQLAPPKPVLSKQVASNLVPPKPPVPTKPK